VALSNSSGAYSKGHAPVTAEAAMVVEVLAEGGWAAAATAAAAMAAADNK